MRAITYNSENEAKKQDGIAPNAILYSGRIDQISDKQLSEWGIGYNDIASLLKEANGNHDEDSVVIIDE